jgi:hypothetical protein
MLERERPGNAWVQAARYPLFLLGLVILVIGELLARSAGVGVDGEAAVAVVGFLFLVLAVALR